VPALLLATFFITTKTQACIANACLCSEDCSTSYDKSLTHGLPAGVAASATTDALAHSRVRSEHEVLPLWLCMSTVLLLVFIESAVWLAMVPSILMW
jgi:hypothetical protein